MQSKSLLLSLIAISGFLLGGCATPTPSNAMVATPAGIAHKHPVSVSIKVNGGAEKSSESASQVSNPDFTAALAKSISQSGVFEKIIAPGEATPDYQLEVTLAGLDQPVIGAAMTATLESNWVLTRHSNGYVMWKKTIKTSHTTAAREAFTGVDRLRLAIEGAARETIRQGLTEIGAITLP